MLPRRPDSSLERLDISGTGCGDAGVAAVAARLTDLSLMRLPAVGEPGWTALAAAYPRLGRLRSIYTNDSIGMGDAGARALAAVPMPRTLKTLSLARCGITALLWARQRLRRPGLATRRSGGRRRTAMVSMIG